MGAAVSRQLVGAMHAHGKKGEGCKEDMRAVGPEGKGLWRMTHRRNKSKQIRELAAQFGCLPGRGLAPAAARCAVLR